MARAQRSICRSTRYSRKVPVSCNTFALLEELTLTAFQSANGKLDDELVLLEMREIKTAIEIEDQLKQSTYKVFVTTSSGRRRLFVIVLYASYFV